MSTIRSISAMLDSLTRILSLMTPPLKLSLAPPASSDTIARAEDRIALEFPEEFKQFLNYGDGQETEPIGDWYFYPCEQFIPSFRFESLGYVKTPRTAGTATGWIEGAWNTATNTELFRQRLSEGLADEDFQFFGPAELHPKYLTFLYSENSGTLAFDMKPTENGVKGQIVSIDTSGFTICVVAPSLFEFLKMIHDGYLSGRFVRETGLERGMS